ncbi:packaged DNA stabilization gp4 family protein [Mixta calida]|uniref:packaged DNA stabilization gp4 family protein n=1 Tax=Mixta calida TaxID=665913 RepID=UPI00289AE716|nr:packaged DNA stabilization gp4 family protein [Mixta calida]MDU5828130.1 packaged DNA stabilization gp4 family protein [Mixta calida]
MNLTTKGDIVRAALRKLGVASDATLTDVEPQSMQDAVEDLELMMAEWYQDGKGIITGYLFSDLDVPPSDGDPHGMLTSSISAVMHNLAVRIAPDYVVEPSNKVVMNARNGKELLYKNTALSRARSAGRSGYPSRMPVGSGNRGAAMNNWNYFHRQEFDDADNTTSADEGNG